MSDLDLMGTMQRHLDHDFPTSVKVYRDGLLLGTYCPGQDVPSQKPYRLVSIQRPSENYQLAAAIVPQLGCEYAFFPEAVAEYVATAPRRVGVAVRDPWRATEWYDNSSLRFTGHVYLYTDRLAAPVDRMVAHFHERSMRLVVRDDAYRLRAWEGRAPDAFICHDSRDKERFVKPLAHELSRRFLKVWYDEFSIHVGDSLAEKIDEGLGRCRYAALVVRQGRSDGTAEPAHAGGDPSRLR